MKDFEGNELRVGDRVGYIDGSDSTARPVKVRMVLDVREDAALLTPNKGARNEAWVKASGRLVRLKDSDVSRRKRLLEWLRDNPDKELSTVGNTRKYYDMRQLEGEGRVAVRHPNGMYYFFKFKE